MYIISDIPKRLEKWFIRCISPPRFMTEMIQMYLDDKALKKQQKLEDAERKQDIQDQLDEIEEQAAEALKQNVGLPIPGVTGPGGEQLYSAITPSMEGVTGNVFKAASTATTQPASVSAVIPPPPPQQLPPPPPYVDPTSTFTGVSALV